MGSPILGVIADLVLQKLEETVFQIYRPKFWARYMDDTFVIIKRDQVDAFHEQLNTVITDIKLTMESEIEGGLSFLDVL